MKRQVQLMALFLAGLLAGIAFVVACGDTSLSHSDDGGTNNCSGSCTVSGPITLAGPITVDSVTKPVTVDSVTNAVTVDSVTKPITVGAVTSAVTVDSITKPVTVDGINTPVAVSSVGGTVAVSGVSSPVAVSAIASPVAIAGTVPVTIQGGTQLSVSNPLKAVTADQDSAQLQSGIAANGAPFVSGPFIIKTFFGQVGTSSGFTIAQGSCSSGTTLLTVSLGGNQTLPVINDIFVPSGYVACGFNGVYSGFKPYQ